MSPVLNAGFGDPIRDSQAVFRALLDAMARPGKIHTVTTALTAPHPLERATAAVLLTVVDGDVLLWLDERAHASFHWVTFHCGVGLTAQSEARFAVALDAPSLTGFYVGTHEEPESSATLILQVAALGVGPTFRLSGPGLPGPELLAVSGLGDRFVAEWEANRRRFPLGIDVILCAGDRLTALPRTVQLECA